MSRGAQWVPYTDCRFFTGAKPCGEHKKNSTLCSECNLYDPIREQVLVNMGENDLFQDLKEFSKQHLDKDILVLTNEKVTGDLPANCHQLQKSSLDDYLYLKGLPFLHIFSLGSGEWIKTEIDELFGVTPSANKGEKQSSYSILIIKTGAAGDVLRTTPLLKRLRNEYPLSHITWLTRFTRFVPATKVDRVLEFCWQNCVDLVNEHFDWIINLDKQKAEVGIATGTIGENKNGFVLNALGRVVPTDIKSHPKWETGIFDPLLKANTKSYLEETFEMVGYSFGGEEYILEGPNFEVSNKAEKIRIGLNIGAGTQWRETRLWPLKYYASLAKSLFKKGYEVELLGGELEDEDNKKLHKMTGASYRGLGSYDDFIRRMSSCDAIVTSVTMALHLALALKKRVVLLNNIFNKREFYLYNRGSVIEPPVKCLGCYKPRYDENCPVSNCMKLITPDKVEEALISEIKKLE